MRGSRARRTWRILVGDPHGLRAGSHFNLDMVGDCENVDMRWELREAFSNEVLLQSLPLSAADTVSQTWCLAEGCYELVWNDQGGDGFSGAYCGEQAGMRSKGHLTSFQAHRLGLRRRAHRCHFCVSVPWCYADFNGDGTRSVDDLLTMLSDFGCQTSATQTPTWTTALGCPI